MLLTDWNIDDAKRVWEKEAREDGIKLGEERGYNKAAAQYQAEIAALRQQLAERQH